MRGALLVDITNYFYDVVEDGYLDMRHTATFLWGTRL